MTSAAFAAPPGVTISGTAPDLQGKADYYARVAADYRARMRTDEKRAIIYFTLANHWDQKAQRYHLAAVHPPFSGVRIWKVRWHAHTEGILLAREAGGVTMGRTIVAAGAFRLPWRG